MISVFSTSRSAARGPPGAAHRQPEARLQLVGPLPEHRRRCRDDDEIDALAQQELAQDQPALDRLAEPDIVGDQEVDAPQLQCLAQRLELIVFEADAGPERRLKQARIGRRDAAPAHGAGISGEHFRIVEALGADAAPAVVGDHAGVEFVLPEHRDQFALRVVVDAGGADQSCLAEPRRRLDALDQPAALPQVNQLPGLGQCGRCVHAGKLEKRGNPTNDSMSQRRRTILDGRSIYRKL